MTCLLNKMNLETNSQWIIFLVDDPEKMIELTPKELNELVHNSIQKSIKWT